MDFSLNSSVVLAAIVGLWLVWVVPFFLRRSGPAPAPAAASTPTAGEYPPQGSIMENTAAAAGSASAHRSGSTAVPGGRPALKIRRGRAAVALVGAAALLAALVTLVLAVVSVVSFWWPVAAVLVTAGAVATLRTLAVRDRRARVNAAFAAAMSSRPLHQASTSTGSTALPGAAEEAGDESARVRTSTVFDAEQPSGAAGASSATPEAPAAPLTAADLKAAALAVAAANAPEADATAATQAPAAGTDPWEPVSVPLPTYVAAEKAQRSAPAPLELPAEPKPTVRTPIKNSAAKAAPKDTAAPAQAGTRLNLDDVLQRRRA